MANRTYGESVMADSKLRGGLSQIHRMTDGFVQFNVLPQKLL